MPSISEADHCEADAPALRHLRRDAERSAELQRSSLQRTPMSTRRLRAALLYDRHRWKGEPADLLLSGLQTYLTVSGEWVE